MKNGNNDTKKSSDLADLLKLSRDYSSSMEKIRQEEPAGDSAAAKGTKAVAVAMPPLKEELVLWTAVAGLSFHVDEEDLPELMDSLTPGTELLLYREPDNEHDHWAIMVLTKGKQLLGYVTRFKNETIARMMDYGYRFRAQVESQEDFLENLPDKKRTPTERDYIPFTIWLISEEDEKGRGK